MVEDTCHQINMHTITCLLLVIVTRNACWLRMCWIGCNPDMYWVVGVAHDMCHYINIHTTTCLLLVIIIRNICWPKLCWIGCNPNMHWVVKVTQKSCNQINMHSNTHKTCQLWWDFFLRNWDFYGFKYIWHSYNTYIENWWNI